MAIIVDVAGAELEFPDGTLDNVIEQAAQNHIKTSDEGSLIKGLGAKIDKPAAQNLLKSDDPEKTTFAQRIGATGEPEKRTPFGLPEQLGAGVTGLAEGATLGAANLLPGFKREKKKAEEFPKTKAAGEIASAFLPGGAVAKTFGAGGKIASKLLPKAAPIAQKALAAGLGGAVTEGVRGATETGEIDIGRGVKKGAIGALTSAGLTAGFEKLAPLLKQKAADFAKSVIKPLKANTRQNFQPERIFELGVDGTLGEMVKKSGKKITNLSKQLDDVITEYSKANPDKTFNIDEIFENAIKKVGSGKGKGIKPGEFEAAEKAIKKVQSDLIKSGAIPGKAKAAKKGIQELLGTPSEKAKEISGVGIDGLRKIKGAVGDIAFDKTRFMDTGDTVKREALKNLWIDIIEEFTQAVPKAKGLGKDIADLKVIEATVEQAIERIGNKDQIGLGDLVLLAGKGALSKIGFAGRKALAGGRGSKLTSKIADLAKDPRFQKGASSAGAQQVSKLFGKNKEGSTGRNF